MKFIFYLPLLLLMATNSFTFYDHFSKPIKGGFTKCDIYTYHYKFGEIDPDSKRKVSSQKYNAQGKMIEEVDYDIWNNNGRIYWKRIYKHNNQGNLIEEVEYTSNDQISWKRISNYNSQGNLIESVGYNSNGVIYDKAIFKYNSQGYKIGYVDYDKDGVLNFEYTYKYDDQFNLIESIGYTSKGVICDKAIFKWDNKGNIVQRESYLYNHNSEIIYKDKSRYDRYGNLIEKIEYSSIGEPEKLNEYIYSKQKH